MTELSPELEPKFVKFRSSYESALVWLADAGGNSQRKASNAFETAKRDVPVSEVEEQFFRRLLFAEPPPIT